MRQYELTYLVSDNVLESEINKVTGKVGGFVDECGGKILKEEIWGRRKLAYPIKKQNFATYITINLELPKKKVKEFEHDVRVTENIIRQILLVKDLGQEKIELTHEDVAEAKDIEEVIGGEKSFEAVEGETEESRKLMQKRDKEEIAEQEDEKIEAPAEEKAEEKKEEAELNLPPTKQATIKKSAKKPAKKDMPKDEKEITVVEKVNKEKKQATKDTPKKPVKKEKKEETSQEAERLSKLDKELEDILGEEL